MIPFSLFKHMKLEVASFAAVIGLAAAPLVAFAIGCQGPEGPPGDVSVVVVNEAGPPGPLGPVGPSGPQADASTPRTGWVTGAGLKLQISEANVDKTGTVTVSFAITDGAATPLDLNGVYTLGPVVAGFVISRLDPDPAGGAGQYTSYTTRVHKAVDGGASETQADADQGGTFTEVGVAKGTYTYRFGTKLPAGYDATKTHTIGIWAYRDFFGQRYVSNAEKDFIPAGGAVTLTREVVKTAACNQCHSPLGWHEGDTARRDVQLCILCHTAGMKDPNNGNSLDMKTMVHKIHRGKNLPSVIAGKPYVLFQDTRADDFSTVWFPGEIQNCVKCHQGAQANNAFTRPSRATCGACHDGTSFVAPAPAGMTPHGGGNQTDDSKCATCHSESGISLSVRDAHLTALTDPAAPKLALEIVSVTNTAPGQTPVLRFNVKKDGAAYDIIATPFMSLAATVAGPTSDYAQSTLYTIQGPGAQGTLAADAGNFVYTFPPAGAIPGGATGTFAVGMEAVYKPFPAQPSYSPDNPVAYFAVTDPAPVPRRVVVDVTKCDSCHSTLTGHAGTRRNPAYCVLCHMPGAVDDLVSRTEVASTVARTINFKSMVHRIHRGRGGVQPFVLGALPGPTPANPVGTPQDFGTVRYPGQLKACWGCHASTSYLIPLPAGLLPTKMNQTLACTDGPINPAAYCNARAVVNELPLQPVSAACVGCHDAPSTVGHVETMTASDGTEACATCHGIGKQWDLQAMHIVSP